jgi:hypothetical protein
MKVEDVEGLYWHTLFCTSAISVENSAESLNFLYKLQAGRSPLVSYIPGRVRGGKFPVANCHFQLTECYNLEITFPNEQKIK